MLGTIRLISPKERNATKSGRYFLLLAVTFLIVKVLMILIILKWLLLHEESKNRIKLRRPWEGKPYNILTSRIYSAKFKVAPTLESKHHCVYKAFYNHLSATPGSANKHTNKQSLMMAAQRSEWKPQHRLITHLARASCVIFTDDARFLTIPKKVKQHLLYAPFAILIYSCTELKLFSCSDFLAQQLSSWWGK